MALVSCPECGKEISDVARFCPHCGYAMREAAANQVKRTPLTERKPSRASGIFLCTGGMVMVLGSLLFCLLLLRLGIIEAFSIFHSKHFSYLLITDHGYLSSMFLLLLF